MIDNGQPASAISRVCMQCVRDAGMDGVAVAIFTDTAGARDLLYASDIDAARIDELQFTIGEGPCLDAFVTSAPQLHSDIGSPRSADKWPSFASEVCELGINGVFAFPVFSRDVRLGVLELYRKRRAALTAGQLAAARGAAAALGNLVLAALATYSRSVDRAVVENRSSDDAFQFARSDIDLAVGVLAARMSVPTADAAALLRARAYGDSRSVSSLIQQIVHGNGEFYEEPGGI